MTNDKLLVLDRILPAEFGQEGGFFLLLISAVLSFGHDRQKQAGYTETLEERRFSLSTVKYRSKLPDR